MTIRHTVVDGENQFTVPTGENEELSLVIRVTSEGIIIDVSDESGEVRKSAYQFWSDLEEMTQY